MNKHIKTFGAGLLIIPLLLTSVGIAHGDDTMTTPEEDRSTKTTIEERIKERRDKAKERLTAAQQKVVKGRCKAAVTIVGNAKTRIDAFKTNRTDKYQKIILKLRELEPKLKAAGIDTTDFDTHLKELDTRATAFIAEVEALEQAVDDLKTMDCSADPQGFVATIHEVVTLRQSVIEKGRAFRKYLRETTKPVLKDIREQLQAKKTEGEG